MKNIFFLTLLFSCFLASCQKNITTSPYEYALLSAHVYDGDEVEKLPNHLNPFLDFDEENYKSRLNIDLGKVWTMTENEEWGKLVPYLGVKAFSRGGYFGRAYFNKKNKQIIIAHRGTDLDIKINELTANQISIALEEDNLWNIIKDMDDDYDILNGEIPMQQFEAAQHFVQEVKEAYKKQYNSEPEIIHTGHSLGAVLAELCAVKDDTKAITFESPGSKPLAAQLVDSEALNIDGADITSYNAEPNQINTLHEHLGKVVPLYDESKIQSAYSDSDKIMSLRQHPINELLKRFDEKSGKPK